MLTEHRDCQFLWVQGLTLPGVWLRLGPPLGVWQQTISVQRLLGRRHALLPDFIGWM